MTLRRGSLYLGVFLLAAGMVTLLHVAGFLDPGVAADALGALWPLAIVAIGIGLVLRRTPAAVPAGILAAATPGLVFGGMFVTAPELGFDCTATPAPATQAVTREGAFASTGDVRLTVSCGRLDVTTQPGNAWRVDVRDGDRRSTTVSSDAASLAVNDANRSIGWYTGMRAVAYDVALPTGNPINLGTEVHGGQARLALAGARLGSADLVVDAGALHVDLTGATLDRLTLDLNAGAASVTLPAGDSFAADLRANAGSLEVCAPDGLGLRVLSTTTLGSLRANGLIRSGDAWETPGYEAAPFKADLSVQTSVGSITINPVGGCK